MIFKRNLDFLTKLKKNNNREWFTKNKDLYESNRTEIAVFSEKVLDILSKADKIDTVSGQKSLYRIYRDVRFSKDKTPYKVNWSGSYKRATKLLRGGYYFHIEPGNSFIGGGFWGPESKDLKRIRTNILEFGDDLKAIINSENFKSVFGELQGEKLKVAPKGFDKNHKHIDLLNYKQYLLIINFTDEEVLSPDFVEKVANGFIAMQPFFNFMSEALTTDENGELIV